MNNVVYLTPVVRLRLKTKRSMKPPAKCAPPKYTDDRVTEIVREYVNANQSLCKGCGQPVTCRQTLAVKHQADGPAIFCKSCAAVDADDLPEPIEFRKSDCWCDCHLCFHRIAPGDYVAIDETKGAAHYGCFDRDH